MNDLLRIGEEGARIEHVARTFVEGQPLDGWAVGLLALAAGLALVLSARRRGWAGLAFVLALSAVMLGGCVTASMVTPYTAAEQAVLDEYSRAAEKIMARRQPGLTREQLARSVPNVRIADSHTMQMQGNPAAFVQKARGLMNERFPATIYLDRQVLSYPLKSRALLAHELGHFLSGHTSDMQPCNGRMAACEEEASAAAPALLYEGWGLTWPDAVNLMYAYLISAAKAAASSSTRHIAACGQVRAYAARFNLAVVSECQP